ncbi:transposase [Massilia sp. YIM B02443]|uniref:transposase n=1 Tax=Massilia sp. YIM B02443 TaxID=3050127 RepID=UPI0025B6AA2A|nr:transposase [Massilia sp. YIM B02443]MDN4035607.1 transposase [Massilia sp. YIM B02443]
MNRPLRLEFPGALYHVTARGDNRGLIFMDDADRRKWLSIMSLVSARFNVAAHAYCQMGNHYHLVIETIEGNLSQGMRQLNSIYSQYFNRRHDRVGHVFQGRYKAILIQRESHLFELARYIALNPVRAGLVAHAGEWQWSHYNASIGVTAAPAWLVTDWLLNQFSTHGDRAVNVYRAFVADGMTAVDPLQDVRHQLVLGSTEFEALQRPRLRELDLTAISKKQRRLGALPLQDYADQYQDRDQAMTAAYLSTAFTMREIGRHFGVSYKTVGRAIKRFENSGLIE